MKRKPPWEEESGVQVLRLYKTAAHADWPQVVLLDLTAKQFSEFDRDPLAFAEKYNLYPEQPISWISPCAKPPHGKGIPRATDSSDWLVVIMHGHDSIADCAACPQSTTT